MVSGGKEIEKRGGGGGGEGKEKEKEGMTTFST